MKYPRTMGLVLQVSGIFLMLSSFGFARGDHVGDTMVLIGVAVTWLGLGLGFGAGPYKREG